MSVIVTVKEAKRLIDQHKVLLSNLEYVISKASDTSASISQTAKSLSTQTALRRMIYNDCVSPTDSHLANIQVEQLILNLYRYQKMATAVETAKSFYQYTASDVKQNISLLNPGVVGLSWLLGGKRSKESTVRAYETLTGLVNESYGQTIPHLVSEVDSALSSTIAEAMESFVAQPSFFADSLESICPRIFNARAESPFQAQLTQLSILEQKGERSKDTAYDDTNRVRIAAERMMAFDALQVLRNVPVEEVNREKAGFRVKVLRDAGITTMADVFASSSYQLASLHGISENAALSLKRISQRFMDEVQVGAKIKLSTDNRSKAATELIKSIYVYKQRRACIDELQDLLLSRQASLANAKEVLSSIGNGLPWLFFSNEQRVGIRNAYEEVNSALKDDYAKRINVLTSELSKSKTLPSDNTVWNDFKEHNIEYISILEDIVPGALGNDDSLYGLPEDLAREIQEEAFFPDGLLCTLRRYQEWGVKYILHQKKYCLEMKWVLAKRCKQSQLWSHCEIPERRILWLFALQVLLPTGAVRL